MLVLLILPSIIVIVMSFSSDRFLSFPPPDFSLQWYRHFLADESWTNALWSSLQIATASTVLSCVIGVLAAFAVSRRPGLGKLVMPVLLSPIIVPIVVVGVALYVGFASWGLVGTKLGLVLAHSLGGIGYVVIIVSATLVGFDQRLERASLSMGAGPLRTVRKVTLPLISSGIVAGAIFAFIHSFDEVVVATFLGGYDQKTLPMKMWEDIRHQIDPTIAAVSSLLMLLPAVWLVLLQVSKRRHR
jgi:putative spermidine/putrescine transport system permease protein